MPTVHPIQGTSPIAAYIHLLISVVFPDEDYALRRYAVSIEAGDQRLLNCEYWGDWSHPTCRSSLSAVLCEDWLTDQDYVIIGAERIAGAVQWGRAGEGT